MNKQNKTEMDSDTENKLVITRGEDGQGLSEKDLLYFKKSV